jgi:MFS family permease
VVDKYGRSIVVAGLIGVFLGFGLILLAALTLPADILPWAVAVAMGVAGAGGGAVLAPNQTLALEDVPVTSGGVAGSIGQVGQRIGTAVGLAAATAAFYATVYAETGTASTMVVFQDAYRNAASVVLLFIAVALVIALVDLRARRAGAMLTLDDQ